jgi:hypothetical protein
MVNRELVPKLQKRHAAFFFSSSEGHHDCVIALGSEFDYQAEVVKKRHAAWAQAL